jgi:hypothetical protein
MRLRLRREAVLEREWERAAAEGQETCASPRVGVRAPAAAALVSDALVPKLLGDGCFISEARALAGGETRRPGT